MPSSDYIERFLWLSDASTLRLSKVRTMEFIPGVFTKKEIMEITSIRACPQTTDSSKN